jgi:type IV pilus assembly protein PilO
MPRSFEFRRPALKLDKRDPRVVARLAVGTLLLANVAAALFLFKPWGGSADDLARELSTLQAQLPQRQALLARTKLLVSKIEKGRAEGDQFFSKYVLPRRAAFSSIVGELDALAGQAGIKPKESTFSIEPIDGAEQYGMMTISSNFEGQYGNLTKFVNLVDRSQRFLIIESLQAAPQPAGQVVNVTIKLNVFIREEGGAAL